MSAPVALAGKHTEVDHALALTKPTHAAEDHPLPAGRLPMLHLDEPTYKRPRRVHIVDEIPRLPSGKVSRRALRERLWTSV